MPIFCFLTPIAPPSITGADGSEFRDAELERRIIERVEAPEPAAA
jgi:hypothetical protein